MNITSVNIRKDGFSFNSRYMKIHKPEQFPEKLLKSIKNNQALDEFINSEQPKTLWEKFKSIFKSNEYLDLYYDKYSDINTLFLPADEFIIDMGKYLKNNVWHSERGLRIRATHKDGNNPEERILKEFENIKNFDEKLSPDFNIINV